MTYVIDTLSNLVHQSGFFSLTWKNGVMILIACVLLFFAIKKQYEPLLLVPIAFGMLLVNLFPDIMMTIEESENGEISLKASKGIKRATFITGIEMLIECIKENSKVPIDIDDILEDIKRIYERDAIEKLKKSE